MLVIAQRWLPNLVYSACRAALVYLIKLMQRSFRRLLQAFCIVHPCHV